MSLKRVSRRFLALLAVFSLVTTSAWAIDLTQAIKPSGEGTFSINAAKLTSLASSPNNGPLGVLLKNLFLPWVPDTFRAQLDEPFTLRADITDNGDALANIAFSVVQDNPMSVADYATQLKIPEGDRIIDGLANGLQAIGISKNDELGKFFLALAVRPDGTYLLGASTVEALNTMAAWQGPDAPRHTRGAIYLTLTASPEMLGLDNQGFTVPLHLEVSTFPHPLALTAQVWFNAREFLAGELPIGDATPVTTAMTDGAVPTSIISMENSWIPATLTLDDLKLPDENKHRILEELGSLASFGITWQDMVDVLRGAISVSVGSEPIHSSFGPMPPIWAVMSGVRPELAQALLPAVQAAVTEQGLPVENVTVGEWTGFKTSAASPMPFWLLYGPKGVLLTSNTPTALVPAPVSPVTPIVGESAKPDLFRLLGIEKNGTVTAIPGSSEALIAPLLSIPHGFFLALRGDALLNLQKTCAATMSTLGASEEDTRQAVLFLQSIREIVATWDDGLIEFAIVPTEQGMQTLMDMFR